ncbi:MAG: ArsJ-associated glyceraldehyde-3-phosphate dehydrogenase [Gammaproteobacteria bacterium]|nr:ArsJ-associated glyceraldehyde-3-phosphate dehydrogenase [Gammaproteobacteria bacterium]
MTISVGINGFGRIGRLACRAIYEHPELHLVHINDPGGSTQDFAHLAEFDSVHGRWDKHISVENEHSLNINGNSVSMSHNRSIADTDWSNCDVVIEASGVMRKRELLQGYLDQGVKRVVVSAPVESDDVLNIVIGVNDNSFDPDTHKIVTAASCTTNSLAPAVKVLLENFGIKHASMTTIHSLTLSQNILDAPHKDMRRARACGMSLIPTTTGSARAITKIFPELTGKINGHAVRIPLTNASLTDCVFEVEKPTSAEEVNAVLKAAAEGELKGIMGYEDRPLVSIDYRTDPRSSIVDGLSTMVVNDTQVKLYLWYDNEWGYANRAVELAKKVSSSS